MSFWTALAEIESGGNDYAIGSVGEVSRYQIRPEIWRAYTSSTRYADPDVALRIAERYMAKLDREFEQATGRAPTESDCVILWKSGIAGYEKHRFDPRQMGIVYRQRVASFNNLRQREAIMSLAAAQKPVISSAPATEAKTVPKFFLPDGTEGENDSHAFGTSGAMIRPPGGNGLFAMAGPSQGFFPQVTPCLR
jgi:hypothetical protein